MTDYSAVTKLACDECGRQFIAKWCLFGHIGSSHVNDRSLVCDNCSEGFNLKAVLATHFRVIHRPSIPAFKCQLCAADFVDVGHLNRHQASIHQGIRFECDDCGKLCSDKHNLAKHIMSVHQQLRPFECEMCWAKFSDSSHLKRHRIMHSGKQVQCDQCGLKFEKHSLIDHFHYIHMKLHRCPAEPNSCEQTATPKKKMFCDACSTTTRSRQYLAHHYFSVHMELFMLKCSVCGEMFGNQFQLLRHRNIHG